MSRGRSQVGAAVVGAVLWLLPVLQPHQGLLLRQAALPQQQPVLQRQLLVAAGVEAVAVGEALQPQQLALRRPQRVLPQRPLRVSQQPRSPGR